MAKISVALPIHNMKDARFFLWRNLFHLSGQTFKDFEVVITDNSPDDELRGVIKQFGNLNIRYFKNKERGMAVNTNMAICESVGEFIKILYMDDFLLANALDNAVANIGEGSWLASGCLHAERFGNMGQRHFPRWNDKVKEGENTIGSPSVITIRNDKPLLFDEHMSWLLDCDYYHRLHQRYGDPILLTSFDVVIGVGDHQMTNVLTMQEKVDEYNYIMQKYEHEI